MFTVEPFSQCVQVEEQLQGGRGREKGALFMYMSDELGYLLICLNCFSCARRWGPQGPALSTT